LKVARSPAEVENAFDSARREAEAYFSSSEVYVERYIESPKHLEVQILAPAAGEALWLGVRDCSLQRRHQKLIEETPPPRFADRAADMGAAAVALANACGYVNAGTVEMLVDASGEFFFLEVNARLQVEHTVTEEVLGLDLVACQLQIASGDPTGLTQDGITGHFRGHAIECRINAEDPRRDFAPTPGAIERYIEPDGLGVRVDSGYLEGDEVPAAYDSLVAKLITWGNDREEARVRMLRALDEFTVEGIATTIPAHVALLNESSFVEGTHTTRTVEESTALDQLAGEEPAGSAESNVLMVGSRSVRLWSPAMAASATAAVHGAGADGEMVAPMAGTIIKVSVEEGDSVEAGATIIVLEAMKMETAIVAAQSGTVAEIRVVPGETVAAGQVLAIVG
jgi:acetyl-CoA/propionyl-CoA carboxylase biotin carboxyl carrier protein